MAGKGKKRKAAQGDFATNRRARHDYLIDKTYEAGLVLTGTEVKSLRQGRANLTDGYAYIDTVLIPANGTYTLLVDPRGVDTGSLTLRLNRLTAAAGSIVPGTARVSEAMM